MSAGAVAIIPARLDSRRLPGKALELIEGLPLVVHVLRRVVQARGLDGVWVATDDDGIADAVRSHGGAVVMTDSGHRSGTDRVAEAALRVAPDAIVVNVQGDEPLVEPSTIEALLAAMDDPQVDVATVAAPLVGDPQEPSQVKVVTDLQGRAIYFSRAPIPSGGPWRQHLGLYAFRPDALRAFTGLARGRLERSERLEQLRFLESGLRIQVIPVDAATPSVDTPADLERVRWLMSLP